MILHLNYLIYKWIPLIAVLFSLLCCTPSIRSGLGFVYNWFFTLTGETYNCVVGGVTHSGSLGLSLCHLDFSGDEVELTSANQIDNNNSVSRFLGGALTGGALWDSTNSYIRLGTSSPATQLLTYLPFPDGG